MNSISELRPLTLPPAALAGPGHQTAKAAAAAQPQSATTAPVQDQRPAERARAPEPTRAQSAEQRLRKNRPDEGPPQIGAGAPEIELSFGDFLDLINPLQHIPIVSSIYRAITGDEIGGPAKILGGMLFGGPIGFIASIFETIATQATGRDLGESVLAAFTDQDVAPAVQVADGRDMQGISAHNGGSEDRPPRATGSPGPISGPISGLGGPVGLEHGMAVPVAVTPVALPPSPPGAAGAAGAAVRGTGLDWIEIEKAAQTHAVDEIAVGAPVIAVDIVSADAPLPGSPRLVPNLATADNGFAERMLEALDKYQVLASERFRDNNRAPHRLDLNL